MNEHTTTDEPKPTTSWNGQKTLPMDFLETIHPGTTVNIGTEEKPFGVKVRPVTLADMQEFQEALTRCLLRAGPVWDAIQNEDSESSFFPLLAQTLTPFLLTDLLGLVNRCCDYDVRNLPHWVLADIIDAWLRESFGDPKKSEPWKALLRNLTTAFNLNGKGLWSRLTTAFEDGGTATTRSSGSPSAKSVQSSSTESGSKQKSAPRASKT